MLEEEGFFMIIFRLLEFVFKITATVFIVIFLQISLGGRTLEEYFLSFLRDSERVQSAQKMTKTGFHKIKKDAVSLIRKQLNEEDAHFSIRNIATQQLQKKIKAVQEEGSVEESDIEESMPALTNYLQQFTALLGSMGNIKKSARTLSAVSSQKNQKKDVSQEEPSPTVKKKQ